MGNTFPKLMSSNTTRLFIIKSTVFQTDNPNLLRMKSTFFQTDSLFSIKLSLKDVNDLREETLSLETIIGRCERGLPRLQDI